MKWWLPFVLLYFCVWSMWTYGWIGFFGVVIFLGSLVATVYATGYFAPKRDDQSPPKEPPP